MFLKTGMIFVNWLVQIASYENNQRIIAQQGACLDGCRRFPPERIANQYPG